MDVTIVLFYMLFRCAICEIVIDEPFEYTNLTLSTSESVIIGGYKSFYGKNSKLKGTSGLLYFYGGFSANYATIFSNIALCSGENSVCVNYTS